MKLSMVLPAFNNQNSLNNCLGTLKEQVIDHEVQCLVVDDGSKVPLTVPFWCDLVRIDRLPIGRGSSAAKNYGAEITSGEYLVFIDSDILVLKDTVQALINAMDKCIANYRPLTLLNIMRVSLPEDYPLHRMKDLEKLLVKCRGANTLVNESMDEPAVCWEQNVGMISRELFNRVGKYDQDTFRNWGMNNQDLCLRVIKDGGFISSSIQRVLTPTRLYCFHPWHLSQRSHYHAEKEFSSKWGEPFSQDLMLRTIQENTHVRDSNRDAAATG